MELIAVGISGLLLLAIWGFALKRAILDVHRDQLFDLRDELRRVFATNGWGMDSQLYRNLRDLINGYLRFTERYSLAKYSWIANRVKTDPELQSVMHERMASKFVSTDATQQAYVANLRRRALTVMTNYMILSSGPLLFATVVLFPFALAVAIAKQLFRLVRRGGTSFFNKAIEVHELATVAVDLAAAVLAKRLLRKDFVEEYSFKQC
jgi:hypothetical protein